MANRDFNPWDILFQLEADMRHDAESAMRALMFKPSVDMYETTTALVIKMELAGVRPELLQITLAADDRTLTISGERAERPEERQDRVSCYQLEIYVGPFERDITLPAHVPIDREKITANYRDGFLVISLLKKAATRHETRVIQISQTNE